MRVECRGLTRTFAGPRGNSAALADINFTAEGHEFVSIVGPSGCGKTTLLKLVAGLIEPTEGTVEVSGNGTGPRPRCAFVFQDHGLFPWMTVGANVAFALEMGGRTRDIAFAEAMTFLDRVGLAGFAEYYPRQLSIGMRQRVGVARAFATESPLLLMDEPFAALDSQTRRVLQDEVLRLWKTRTSLVLFVTHDIVEAVRLSDRILVLSGRPGRICEEIQVATARPRDLAPGTDPEVAAIQSRIWQLFEHDVRASVGLEA